MQGLIGNLASGLWIVPAVTGVDDLVPTILVVFIAAVEHDRVRSLGRRPGNAGDAWPMNPCRSYVRTSREECAHVDAGDASEMACGCHDVPSGVLSSQWTAVG